jgi:hypothetical protein
LIISKRSRGITVTNNKFKYDYQWITQGDSFGWGDSALKKIFFGFIVVAIILSFMLTSPNLTGMFVGTEQQETACDSPYIKLGDSCCMDQNSNSICDKDESPPQDEILDIPNEIADETETQNEIEDTCSSPYIEVGSSCCLDQNSNSICDEDEVQTQEETPNAPQEEPDETPEETEPVCVIGPPKIPENPEYYYEGWVDPPGLQNCYEACHMCWYVKDTHECIDNICWELLEGYSCEVWFPMECKKQ